MNVLLVDRLQKLRAELLELPVEERRTEIGRVLEQAPLRKEVGDAVEEG